MSRGGQSSAPQARAGDAPSAPLKEAPPQTGTRDIVRVKFAAFGPGPQGQETKPSRELTRAQAELGLDPLGHGVLIHGKFLVPWPNIYYLEYA